MNGCDCGNDGVSSQKTTRNSPYDMISVNEAIDIVLSQTCPLGIELVKSRESLGRIVAVSAKSVHPLPPFRASTMDGYAVVAADGVGHFPVVNRIAAGDAPDICTIQPGHVAYITTGSPVPSGADAVVRIEDTDGVFDEVDKGNEVAVHILKAAKPGQNIRAIGSDIQPQEVLVAPHDRIGAAELGLLATAGVMSVSVYKQPVVGVLSTGSELVEAFESSVTRPGTIRDSNRPMLIGLLKEWKVQTLDFGIVGDQEQLLKEIVEKSLSQVDVLITSGGVSMGDHDLLKRLLECLGTVHFGRLHMKPGKPTTFATIDMSGVRKFVFALPGNPVSSFTTAHLLVRPALRRLQGCRTETCRPTAAIAKLSHSIRLDAERPEYHRATVKWDTSSQELVAISTGQQISSRLLSCRHANALLSLPTGTEIRAGDAVVALLLDESMENSNRYQEETTISRPTLRVPTNVTAPTKKKKTFRAALLTISDRVSQGVSNDLSGPAMARVLEELESRIHIVVVATAIVADEITSIQQKVMKWADDDVADLILTSGGTGFTPRDVTPEAIKALLHKEIPGFMVAMLQSSLKFTSKAILARPVAGIRARTLIITLPGKPKAVIENFSAIADVLPHALFLVRDEPHEHHKANPELIYT